MSDEQKTNVEQAIDCFLSGKTGKYGNYISTTNALVYRFIKRKYDDSYVIEQNIVAIRLVSDKGVEYLGNSSRLNLLERNVQQPAEVQAILSQRIAMLPFDAFTEAKLDLLQSRVIDKGPQEEVGVKESIYNKKIDKYEDVIKPRHFIGASLFEVSGKQFLFDIDRSEIKNGIFNPFIVELVSSVKTIKEAYESLKPAEVKEAERQGLKVRRQGEWFFIPVNRTLEPMKDEKNRLIRGTLRAGDNRPNYVEQFYGKVQESQNSWGRNEISVEYVTGKVEHSGREHAPIVLKGWYKPVPNTSVKSFTLTGDVD